MQRRHFLKKVSSALLISGSGKIISLSNRYEDFLSRKPVLRFAVASDGHYGQADTDYKNFYSQLVENINSQHRKKPFDFCMINGDIIHDDKKFFAEAKTFLDGLGMKYYVSQGNHDHATPQEWEAVWKMPLNIDFSMKKSAVLIGTTSDEKGTYLCPDVNWFAQKLEEYKDSKNIFIFVHINPVKQTPNAVDCPAFFELLSKYKNIRAVFNGHDHDHDKIFLKNKVPFIFDAHFGGNWGTAYRGFRIVELRKDNSILTYILNPADKLHEEVL